MESPEPPQKLEEDAEKAGELLEATLRAREKSALIGGAGSWVGSFHPSNIP
jgi:hypothetical protein